MPRMLDVSDDVRAEIGEEEAERLLVGDNTPGNHDCTSCRTPGDAAQEPTNTVLFVGDETAVLAFAHASCIPSQVVTVSEEQLQGAVRSITASQDADSIPKSDPRQAVLGVTSGLILLGGDVHPGLVVEPTGPIVRPGSDGPGDDFLTLLTEQGFRPVTDLEQRPERNSGWSVLLAMGQPHAVLSPGADGTASTAWWQAHQPLHVTEGWRAAANKSNTVFVYAAPAGVIGQQPREDDLLRAALERAAARGKLVAAAMPLAGT